MTDEFKTIATISEGYYTEKRSKFLAFAHHVQTTDEVKDIIRKTSYQPEDKYTEKNNIYGWGQIDAYAGILEALALPAAIPSLSKSQPEGITFRLVGDMLYADGADDGTPVTVYSLSGTVLQKATVLQGCIALNGLEHGVYAVQFGTSGSTLIRK